MSDLEAFKAMLTKAGVSFDEDPSGEILFRVEAGIGGSDSAWVMASFDDHTGDLVWFAWDD